MSSVIYTYSIVYAFPTEFSDMAPYIVALVEDETGLRHSVFVNGYREGVKISIGDKVEPDGTDERGRSMWRLA